MKIGFIYSAAFNTPRLINQAKIVSSNLNYDCEIIYWERGMITEINSKAENQLNKEFTVHKIKTKSARYGSGMKNIFPRLLYNWRLLKLLNKRKFNVIHVIDFDSAISVMFHKIVNPKVKIIYDIADFINTFDSNWPSFIRVLIKIIDKVFFRIANRIILPDKNRIANIPKEFHNKISIIPNSPLPKSIEKLKKKSKRNPAGKINIIYYGGFSDERGLNFIFKAALTFPNINFHFAGWGKLGQQIIELSQTNSNVIFHGHIEYNRILELVSQMDLVYIFYDPSYEHNRLASPNKLFESVLLEKPVIVCQNTSIDELVKEHNAGFICSYSEDSIIKLLASMTWEKIINAKEHLPKLSKALGLKDFEQNVVRIYFDTLDEVK